MSCVLEVSEVSKSFTGVQALKSVQFSLKRGTVHALMGENGAGKSTLMKIISGIYQPDQGKITLDGREVALHSARDALDKGIAMIHQELNLMNHMTVAENIWIRREPKNRFGFINHAEMERKTTELLNSLGIRNIRPNEKIGKLSVSLRQLVEIAKAYSFDSNILIMDEPTSALTEKEVDLLFSIIRKLKNDQKSIIYITHKMNELHQIADEVSVFRDGEYIDTLAIQDCSKDKLIRLMVGRDINNLFPKTNQPTDKIALEVKNLCLDPIFCDVSFNVKEGEILGVAGLVGAGRSNIAETIFGITPATAGEILIKGQPITIESPKQAMSHGIGFLTEDRKETGCFLILNVLENIRMASIFKKFVQFGFIQGRESESQITGLKEKLRIKTPNLSQRIENLSGGNQQKSLIARWLLTAPKILILDEPTRGIDVGAKSEIHQLISDLADQGVAIIMISSEMPEILGMSDRILVMHQGRLKATLDRNEASQELIMSHCTD